MRFWRFFGIEHATVAERRATFWIAAMFCAALASTFVLRPLRDQFGVERGTEQLPWLYGLTLIATALAVPPFWWLANRLPSRRFIPIVVSVCAAALCALAIGLAAIGDYDWKQVPWLGEAFWGGFSAFNVVVPSLVWIHAVEHFDRERARRLFGLVAVGGTLGAIAGSWGAGVLSEQLHAPPWIAAVASAVLLVAALGAYRASLPHCTGIARAQVSAQVAGGGLLQGVRILLADGYVRRIGLYMMLLGVLATAFYAAQTDLVGEEMKRARQQHVWLADVEFWGQSLILALQLFCTGRLLTRWPPVALLISLPLVSIVGLGIWWLWPAAIAIFAVQVARRGAQFAFEKPAREVLYTPLDLETKHKVKFLLDTFAFRLGDLLGAFLQVGLRDWQLSVGGIVLVTTAVALVWIALGISLGRREKSTAGEVLLSR